jgi:hypothetical protein
MLVKMKALVLKRVLTTKVFSQSLDFSAFGFTQAVARNETQLIRSNCCMYNSFAIRLSGQKQCLLIFNYNHLHCYFLLSLFLDSDKTTGQNLALRGLLLFAFITPSCVRFYNLLAIF